MPIYLTWLSGLLFGLLALLIVGSPAAQTTYPEKPIRMVVGFPPGGQQDTVARLLGQKLADLGLEGTGNSPNEFAAAIKSEIPKLAKVIKDAGIATADNLTHRPAR